MQAWMDVEQTSMKGSEDEKIKKFKWEFRVGNNNNISVASNSLHFAATKRISQLLIDCTVIYTQR